MLSIFDRGHRHRREMEHYRDILKIKDIVKRNDFRMSLAKVKYELRLEKNKFLIRIVT